ncbi:MAG TPA: hypothetical protein VKE88_02890 [Candidatus Nanoarchaeia archaeon]|nr:hypothetical protein [Candidatus Nanoarchaeia archaeon]
MKHTNYVVFFAACILLSTSVFAQVAITPSNPSVDDDLVCSLAGANSAAYIFEWIKNSKVESSSQILSRSATDYAQVWTCRIIVPPTPYTGTIVVGEASVTMPAYVAPVIPQNFVLSVFLSGNGTGLVSSNDSKISCGSTCIANYTSESVTLTATGNLDNAFTGWSGACSGKGNCTVLMNQSNNVTATFMKPTVYGRVYDTDTGLVVSGAKISSYDDSICSIHEINLVESGDCTLNPKVIPDAVSDSFGNYSLYLPRGKFYQIVVQHSKQVDKNVLVNDSQNETKIDHEVKEGVDAKNLNFEGHIQYSGNLRNGNKYVAGDPLKFVMFGVNNGATDATVSYMIESHVSGGSNGPWVYNGSFVSETLTVPANGNKVNKQFNITLPLNLVPGRYDIHVLYNESGVLQKWHKIGNFFIINDITPPEVNTLSFLPGDTLQYGQYVNQTANVTFKVQVVPQVDTVPGLVLIAIAEVIDDSTLPVCNYTATGDEVTVNAQNARINVSGSSAFHTLSKNVSNAYGKGCIVIADLTYFDSRHYNGSVTFKKQNGLVSAPRMINASVWATEQQARDIYFDIIEQTLSRPGSKPENFTGYYAGDRNPGCGGCGGYGAFSNYNVTKTNSVPIGYFYINTDLFDTQWGFEYQSQEDGLDIGSANYSTYVGTPKCGAEPEVNGLGATNCERDATNAIWATYSGTGPYYILTLNPMIRDEIAKKVIEFGDFLVSQGSSP